MRLVSGWLHSGLSPLWIVCTRSPPMTWLINCVPGTADVCGRRSDVARDAPERRGPAGAVVDLVAVSGQREDELIADLLIAEHDGGAFHPSAPASDPEKSLKPKQPPFHSPTDLGLLAPK
jgi:hypothetical protein